MGKRKSKTASVDSTSKPMFVVPPVALKYIFWGAIAFSLLFRLLNIDFPIILEQHGFRQSQTAITIQTWLFEGYEMINYPTPVFGPPWTIPFEFPVYQTIVYFVMTVFGMTDVDLGCRIVGIVFFYLSAFMLYKIATLFAKRTAAFVVLLFYLFCPFTLYWSRSAMIDYTSVFFGLGYFYFFYTWFTQKKIQHSAYSILFGVLCSLCKTTTLMPMVMMIAAMISYAFSIELANLKIKKLTEAIKHLFSDYARLAIFLALAIIPLAVGFLWANTSEMIRASSEATAWNTAETFNEWHYGTLEQRLQPEMWWVILDRIWEGFAPNVAILALLPLSIAPLCMKKFARERFFIVSCLVVCFVTILLSFNLYLVHNYYLMAISPLICMFFGFGLYYLCGELLKKNALLIICVVSILSVSFLQPQADYTAHIFRRDVAEIRDYLYNSENLYTFINKNTTRDEYTIIAEQDWSPVTLYQAQRKGFMLRNPYTPTIMEMLTTENFKYFVTSQPLIHRQFLTHWKSAKKVAELDGTHIYQLK